ncbi:hypothetical protein HU200_061764 [Digitaria exilis]|uniref:Uncharacterized protein n=1 Tax=Digitaria exilis TaxID=1010633 RepID=A0A835AER3_9POAL|nr:hypothetical protein HU200_061764 [Digitaria exilis]
MAADATTSSAAAAAYPPPALPASRQDIQAAVAKAAELRALHAALLQGGANAGGYASASRSPAVIRLPPAASPALSRPGLVAPAAAAAEDYPVFAPVSLRILQLLALLASTHDCTALHPASGASCMLHPCLIVRLRTIVLFFGTRSKDVCERCRFQFNRWSLVGVKLDS